MDKGEKGSKGVPRPMWGIILWYGNGAGNTIEKNASIISVIQRHQFPSARALQ